MVGSRAASRWIGMGIAGCVLLSAGCTGSKHQDRGVGMESGDQHALFDRDSRNNEDDTLGVKAKWLKEQSDQPTADNPGAFQQLDMTNAHLTKTMRFAPEAASQLKQIEGIKQVTVLLTEVNAYAAVVLEGHDAEAEGDPAMSKYRITPKGGVGLFSSSKGNAATNWGDPGGLGYAVASRISGELMRLAQPHAQRVFVSANANFVRRIHFYEKEFQSGTDLSVYMNEFNTLIQRVFPNNRNAQ
jgi:hypothetical protein